MTRPIVGVALLMILAGCAEPDVPINPAEVCTPTEEIGPDGRCRPIPESCVAGQALVAGECIGPRCVPGEYLEDSTCLPAGRRQDWPCDPGEIDSGGGCTPAGVPEDGCAVGFEHDADGGCEPILPSERCTFGMMAIPGESDCRAIDDCGTGTWGNIPTDTNSVFVNASYQGVSDGTADSPWKTISEAYTDADSGAVIAIAAGTYLERVHVNNKPVKLWGRCSSMVTIVAPNGGGDYEFAVLVFKSSGTEVHNLAMTVEDLGNDGAAFAIGDSNDVLGDQVHVHGSPLTGAFIVANDGFSADLTIRDSIIEDNYTNVGVFAPAVMTIERSVIRGAESVGAGATSPSPSLTSYATLNVRQSLVEDNLAGGIACLSCVGVVEATVVRGTRSGGDPNALQDGSGISAAVLGAGFRAFDITVRGCLVEDNESSGIALEGGTALIQNTVVRDTRESTTSMAGDTRAGHGINVTSATQPDGRPSEVVIRGSLVERNVAVGINVGGSLATVQGVIVRETSPVLTGPLGGNLGVGIQALKAPGQQRSAELTVIGSLVANSSNAGIAALDAVLTVKSTVVRDTDEDLQGAGFGILAAATDETRQAVTIDDTVCENSLGVGIALMGVDAQVSATEVRGTQTNSKGVGIAVDVQYSRLASNSPSESLCTLRGLLLERNEDAGIAIIGSTVTVEGAVIRETLRSTSGNFGDAIQVQSLLLPAKATLVAILTEDSARAGISSFGADVYLEAGRLTCQAFDMSVEDTEDFEHTLTLGDFNACGCGGEADVCLVESDGLAPLMPFEQPD